MKLIISKEVKQKFPDLELVLLPVNNCIVRKDQSVINEADLIQELALVKQPGFFDLPYFAAFRNFYKQIGLNPELEPPAAENLFRTYLRKNQFSRINNIVDASNLASIKTFVPLGVFDTDKIKGNLVLRYTESGEEFRPLGGRVEILPEGIITISDEEKLFSKFPYRDSVHAAITDKTKNVLIIADKIKGFNKEDVVKAATLTGTYIEKYAQGKVTTVFFSQVESEKVAVTAAIPKKTTEQKVQRVFSGIRATGRLHLGNYLGAVKGFLELQKTGKYETVYCVVDVHTITTPFQVEELRKNKREIIIDYLAAGLDPEKSMLIYQSDVPEHMELAFYFSSVMTVARMMHLPTYKEKIKQYPNNITMALLNYPILMAADILVYKAGLVPVGIDQEPHLEVTREVARKMNQLYGTDFPEPVRFATKGEYVPSLSGEGKMSKTIEGTYINLTDSMEDIRKKIRSIPTASQSGGEMNTGLKSLFAFADLFIPSEIEGFKKQFSDGSLKFVEIKDAISEAIYKELQPFQEKRKEIEKDQKYVNRVIKQSAEKARSIASKTVKEVKEKMGLI